MDHIRESRLNNLRQDRLEGLLTNTNLNAPDSDNYDPLFTDSSPSPSTHQVHQDLIGQEIL